MIDLKLCKHVIFRGGENSSRESQSLLLDKVSSYWFTFWSKHFQECDPHYQLCPKEILRHDLISVLFFKDEIIGSHLLSIHSLAKHDGDPYMRNLTPEIVAELREWGDSCLSMRYYQIDPNFLPGRTKVNFPAILLGLSLRIQHALEVDFSFSIARTDVAAVNTSRKFGFEILPLSFQMHNHPVCAIACRKPLEHPRKEVAAAVLDLWNNRRTFDDSPSPFDLNVGLGI